MMQESPSVETIEMTVRNPNGLYSRAAAKVIRLAQTFHARLFLKCGGLKVQDNSVIGLLSLAAGQGATVTASAEGPEAKPMIRAVESLFADEFRDPDGTPERASDLIRKADRSPKGTGR